MESYTLTVFYDGGCPLCRREIEHYRKLKPRMSVTWIDITQAEAPLADYGVDRDAAMRRFHVRDAAGRFFIGAPGFVTLWTQLPYYRYLAAIVRGLSLIPFLDQIYVRFADWHYGRRCAEGVCAPVGKRWGS